MFIISYCIFIYFCSCEVIKLILKNTSYQLFCINININSIYLKLAWKSVVVHIPEVVEHIHPYIYVDAYEYPAALKMTHYAISPQFALL